MKAAWLSFILLAGCGCDCAREHQAQAPEVCYSKDPEEFEEEPAGVEYECSSDRARAAAPKPVPSFVRGNADGRFF